MRIDFNSWRRALLVATVVLATPALAEADAGVPMIVLVWPGFWLLLLPIVVLEGSVARRVFQMPWKGALKLSAEANLVSTLVGIPLTWLVLFIVEMLAAGGTWVGFQAAGVSELPKWAEYMLMLLSAPWVGGEEPWIVPAAAIWLSVFFFLTSVWIERRVVARRTSLPATQVRTWSWQANILSYIVIEVLMLGLLAWTLLS